MSPERERRSRKPNKRKEIGVSKSTRRRFLTKALIGSGALGLAAVGVGILSHEDETTIEDQIKYFEYQNQTKDTADQDLRTDYQWLLDQWYEKYTFGRATAKNFWDHTFYIIDENDENLKGNEMDAGWALDDIFINLLSSQFHQKQYASDGTFTYPFASLREVMTHEMTHLITQKRTDSESIEILSKKEDKKLKYVKGFRLYYDSDENPLFREASILDNFDEAVTEFIANYYQKFSGFTTGAPNYPEDDQIPGQRSKIELVADTLQANMSIAGIRVEDLAKFHAFSDLDELAIGFAEKTKRTLKDNKEKIVYGLSVIEAINSLDHNTLTKYRDELKK